MMSLKVVAQINNDISEKIYYLNDYNVKIWENNADLIITEWQNSCKGCDAFYKMYSLFEAILRNYNIETELRELPDEVIKAIA